MKLEVAPDKGWAWVVAFASCLICMLLSGISRTVAMLYVEIINTYEVPRKSATIPFSVRNSVRCIAGPLVGIAGQYFQVRSITFWGGAASFVGIALCSFASNIFWLTIFWGIINGLGFAFGNTLFIVVINQYFKRHRTTACGIALSGGGLGTLLFPFLLETIISNYDLAGVFLLLAGIAMQVMPLSLLLRSPPWNLAKKEKENIDYKSHLILSPTSSCTGLSQATEQTHFTQCNVTQNFTAPDGQKEDKNIKNNECCKNEYLKESYTLSVPHQSKPKCKAEEEEIIHHSKTLLGSCRSILELFLNPLYILLNMCYASYGIVLSLISTIIVDYGKDKGISESGGKYLIICAAAGDLIGRLCFGWVTDKKYLSAQKFVLLMLIFQGAVTAAIPFVNDFIAFSVLLTSFGIISASTLVVLPGWIVDCISTEKQPLAMSCLHLLTGLVNFAIPSFIGHFRDNIGSYDGLFYISGGISALCGSLWTFEPFLMKFLTPKDEIILK